MVTVIAKRTATWLAIKSDQIHQLDKLRYGIEILITGFLKFICLFLAAGLTGVLYEMMVLTSVFVIFRLVSGGVHLSLYSRCLIVGIILLVGLSYIASIIGPLITTNQIMYLMVGTIILGLIFFLKYAPSNHFYRKSTIEKKKKLKMYSIVALCLWGIIQVLLLSIISHQLLLAFNLGLLLQLWSIHPSSYIFMQKVEKILGKR